jgi:PhoPQ-activated pathogenicity-related protein
MRRCRISSLVAALAAGFVAYTGAGQARADLDDYLKKPDSAYAWTVEETRETPAGSIKRLKLTSQVWQGITWGHRLQIFTSPEAKTKDTMLLFITGGGINNISSKSSPQDDSMGFTMSKLTGARVAILSQVPNQPLLGDKTEDTLIAETFVRYLETKDENWPLLFPMVKSAVRAMDALQALAREEKAPEVSHFVVTGASKRGWTTWLTSASDPRIIACAPMVIDTLNMKAQFDHAKNMWGGQSEQIGDYTGRGLTDKFETVDGKKLWSMVDPFSYRERLTLPKLIINGTNDPYWTLDSLNIYWDDLKGAKSVVYLPNAGHGLDENRDYALHGIGALFRHAVQGKTLPKLDWKHSNTGDGALKLTVTGEEMPKSAKLWVARSATKDFRKSRWEPLPMEGEGTSRTGVVARPESGFIGLVGDLEFEIEGVDYHLSTQVRQAGATPQSDNKADPKTE